MEWETIIKVFRNQNWVILMILGCTSFFIMSPTFTLGILLGGLLIIANFSVLQHTINRGFMGRNGKKISRKSVIVKFYLRLLILGLLLFVLITRGLVHPVGLAIGLSVIVISIVNLAFRIIWKRSSKEAV